MPIPNVLIISTHPIQYQVPWFQFLAKQPTINLKVLYLSFPNAQTQGIGFGIPFEWDIPLLEGYDWQLLEEIYHLPFRFSFLSSLLKNPVQLLQELQPDIVLLTGWQCLPLVQLLFACRQLTIPCLVRGESNGLKPRPPWIRWIHQILLSNFSAYLAIGHANRHFYITNQVPKTKIFHCPYFVDNQRFLDTVSALKSDRQLIRKSFGIPCKATCFLYVGKLEKKKHLLDLIDAFAIAFNQKNDKLYLLVVGSGELLADAQKKVAAQHLPVTFAGFLNQSAMPRAYVAADCLVLPSDYGETWGLVVNEAMACGLPAIVSDRVGCGPDLVLIEETGFIFPFGEISKLSDYLVWLVEHSESCEPMGYRAQSKILTEYSLEVATKGFFSALRFLEIL